MMGRVIETLYSEDNSRKGEKTAGRSEEMARTERMNV
jgi:hypothetical protein